MANSVNAGLAKAAVRKFGLQPVIDELTEVLIMGTFPSDVSLASQQYYANPSNDFWRLISAVLNQDVGASPYTDQLALLKYHRFGLWDVYRSCVRQGSLDSAISEPEFNDFSVLRSAARLRLVCFNGKEAAKSENTLRGFGYETRVLPSSSSANRSNSAERIRMWASLVTTRLVRGSAKPR